MSSRLIWASLAAPLLAAALAAACGGKDGEQPAGPSDRVPASVTIVVSPTGAMKGLGSVRTLAAEVRDADGRAITRPRMTWETFNPGVIELSHDRGSSTVATAVGTGSATIRAVAPPAPAASVTLVAIA